MAKNNFIRIRVSEQEKQKIMRKAAQAHMNLSEFVRRSALDKPVNVLSGTDDELLLEFRRQGNNLNQLTVMARQGRIQFVNFEPFMEVYEQAWQALNSSLSRVV